MYKLTYGLFVCTAVQGDKINGCIINTAIQAASKPNTITVAINKANYCFSAKGRDFLVNFLFKYGYKY